MPDRLAVDATVAIEKTRLRECRDASEVKFQAFRKSEGKREAAFKLIAELGRLGLIPLYVLAEKRYCIAGKIVETYLDPFYNPALRLGFTSDITTKRELANTLYDVLPESVLTRFADAYRVPTVASLTVALNEVVEATKSKVNPELASLLEKSLSGVAEIAAAEVAAANTYEKAGGTINFPCLVSFIAMVEKLAGDSKLNPRRLVHDEQGPYQSGFEQLFREHRDSAENGFQFVGERLRRGAPPVIREFEIQRSIDQPLIQAADMLAGAVNYVSMRLNRNETLTPSERNLAEITLRVVDVSELRLAWLLCSDRMHRRIRKFLAEEAGEAVPQSRRHSELPLFPIANQAEEPSDRVKLTLPLYGITRVSDGAIMSILNPDIPPGECGRSDQVILFFTEREDAERFYDMGHEEWDGAQQVREFEVKDLAELTRLLRESVRRVGRVVFNPFGDRRGFMSTEGFLERLSGIVERTLRADRMGVGHVLLQRHQIDRRTALSFLLSTGRYGAMWDDDQKNCFYGTTREAALDALQNGAK